jgi:hypothetical protein
LFPSSVTVFLPLQSFMTMLFLLSSIWTALPAALSYPAASSYGHFIYVSGGAGDAGNTATFVSTVYVSVPEFNQGVLGLTVPALTVAVALCMRSLARRKRS